jgi:hypothetical protein
MNMPSGWEEVDLDTDHATGYGIEGEFKFSLDSTKYPSYVVGVKNLLDRPMELRFSYDGARRRTTERIHTVPASETGSITVKPTGRILTIFYRHT